MKRFGAVSALVACSLGAGADDYQEAWGPPTDSAMLSISAADQHGAPRDLANLGGANGLLLFAFRSADW